MSDPAPKKEKKDKKRKSLAVEDGATTADGAIKPVPVPPEQGTVSAEAVEMEVDGDKAAKKARKEDKKKRKSLAADESVVTAAAGDDANDSKSEFFVPLDAISPIASPLAGKKLSKKLFRTVKRSSKNRQLKRGVKEVVKALRKGDKGLLLLASNITPVDVVSHLPLMAEEAAGVEYCWVLSKEELGAASGTKRATSCVLISSVPQKRPQPKEGQPPRPAPTAEEMKEWEEGLKECMAEVKKLEQPIQY